MDTPTGLSLPVPSTTVDLTQSFSIDARTSTKPDAAQAAQLAQEFEAMLVLQMVKQMRQSFLPEDDQEKGFGAETMTDTFDTEFARYLTQKGGIGVQEFIKSQLAKSGDAGSTPSPSEGGASAKSGEAGTAVSPAVDRAPSPPTPSPKGEGANSKGAVSASSLGDAATRGLVGESASDDEPLTLPLDGAATTSKFGWRQDPFQGRRRFHSGVDLRAAYGTEVPAAGGGRVTFAGDRGGYGTLVTIQHEDGVETRYAHLSATDVREGDRVEAGQTIGRVGSSGRSTGAHLHFEVLVNGARVDPTQVTSRNLGEFKSVRALVD